MRKGDFIIFVLMALIGIATYAGFTFFNSAADDQHGYTMQVSLKGELLHEIPLNESDEPDYVTIPLDSIRSDYPSATATLEHLDGQVRVMPMPLELCPEEICHTVMGRIGQPGQIIVCMPNQMVITIIPNSSQQLDYDILVS